MLYSKNKLEHGYANKILSIDLGKDAVRVEDLDPVVRDYFLGGRGLGLYLLYRHIGPATRATDPENPLISRPVLWAVYRSSQARPNAWPSPFLP